VRQRCRLSSRPGASSSGSAPPSTTIERWHHTRIRGRVADVLTIFTPYSHIHTIFTYSHHIRRRFAARFHVITHIHTHSQTFTLANTRVVPSLDSHLVAARRDLHPSHLRTPHALMLGPRRGHAEGPCACPRVIGSLRRPPCGERQGSRIKSARAS
jgi:hypothetical protein